MHLLAPRMRLHCSAVANLFVAEPACYAAPKTTGNEKSCHFKRTLSHARNKSCVRKTNLNTFLEPSDRCLAFKRPASAYTYALRTPLEIHFMYLGAEEMTEYLRHSA